jgi:hypothetical protein
MRKCYQVPANEIHLSLVVSNLAALLRQQLFIFRDLWAWLNARWRGRLRRALGEQLPMAVQAKRLLWTGVVLPPCMGDTDRIWLNGSVTKT